MTYEELIRSVQLGDIVVMKLRGLEQPIVAVVREIVDGRIIFDPPLKEIGSIEMFGEDTSQRHDFQPACLAGVSVRMISKYVMADCLVVLAGYWVESIELLPAHR